jgi:hypothetical protein
VTTDQDFRDLLVGLDDPVAPRPEFSERLRAELFTDTILDQDEPRSKPSKFGWIAGVAAAVIAIGMISVLLNRGAEPALDPRPADEVPTTLTVDTARVSDACRAFRASAFTPRTRDELLGPRNSEHLTTMDAAQEASRQLRAALLTLSADLATAGVRAPQFDTELAQAINRLDRIITPEPEDANLPKASWLLTIVDQVLVRAQTALATEGLGACL